MHLGLRRDTETAHELTEGDRSGGVRGQSTLTQSPKNMSCFREVCMWLLNILRKFEHLNICHPPPSSRISNDVYNFYSCLSNWS